MVVRVDGGKGEGMVQPTMTMGLAGEDPVGALSEGAEAKADTVGGRPLAVQARWFRARSRGASDERGRSVSEHQGVVSRLGETSRPCLGEVPMGPAKIGRAQLVLSPACGVMAPFERASIESGEPLGCGAWGSP